MANNLIDDPIELPDGPKFCEGDRVYVNPLKMEATVIRQIKHYDYPDEFWGDVELQYDDGVKGRSHSWQVEKISPCTCHPDDDPPVPCARKYALTECRKIGNSNDE